MLFNSVEFVVFFILFFIVYWKLKSNLTLQNVFLLVGSYVFYGWWDVKFLLLILISSVTDYTIGYYIDKATKKTQKKILLAGSLGVNLGLLFFFKYYNFFIDSLVTAFAAFNINLNISTLQIILPVGISFYTFQTLSYSIDIYRGTLKPTKDILSFLNFVSFFPQLVAGPIERAKSFLPQFHKPRVFKYEQAVDGMRLLLYGAFKKIVIADYLAQKVDIIYATYPEQPGFILYYGSILFTIQLYADFSGYSDMAIGMARLLGFNLMTNFKTPFFTTNIPDSWNRWHISLTTWFRDYVFIPLARMNKQSLLWRIVATVILFSIIGIWHGANYTFLAFGVAHGLCFIPRLTRKKIPPLNKFLLYINNNRITYFVTMFLSFCFLSFITIFFRSVTITDAFIYMNKVFTQQVFWGDLTYFKETIALIVAFFAFEYFMQDKSHQFEISSFHPALRKLLYVLVIFSILLFGNFGKTPFYYFQF